MRKPTGAPGTAERIFHRAQATDKAAKDEIETERRLMRAKTARLKELRLSRDAAEVPDAPTPPPPATKAKRKRA